MKLIDTLTQDASQNHTLILDTGEKVNFKLYYLPRIQQWTFDISYNDINIYGQQFTLGFNLLRQWKNLIPFGLAVQSDDNIDPYLQNDFITNRIKLYILNPIDIQSIEDNIYA